MNPTPYVFIPGGSCAEALNAYAAIFGGEVTMHLVKDGPMAEQMPDSGDLVMHGELKTAGGVLMASDNLMDPNGTISGAMVMMEVGDKAACQKAFDALAEGGEVRMPFGPTFWQDGFGMVVDRFGVGWMISTNAPPAG